MSLPNDSNLMKSAPITIMAAKFWPMRHGGVESHLWHMASTLAKLDQPVRVLTENRDDLPAAQTIIPCLHVRRFDRMNFGKLWRWPHALQVKWWMNVLRTEQPQGVIWATQPCMAVAAILTGYRKQLVFNPACCVAAMRHIGQQYAHMHTMQQPRLSQWIEQLAVRFSPRIVVSSNNLVQQFQKQYCPSEKQRTRLKNKIEVLPLATATLPQSNASVNAIMKSQARTRWHIPAKATVIGFVGRLDPCKDLDFLFHAAAHTHAHQKHSDGLRLLIVGDGPDRQRLETLASQLGLSKQVIFTGNLDQPASAYQAMDAMALTSAYEAYGLVILEAMAHGLPVLGRRANQSNVLTACDEIITHGMDGLLINANETNSLARSIDALASLPVLRQTLGACAKRTASAFNWDNYAQRCLKLLKQSQPLKIPEAQPLQKIISMPQTVEISRDRTANIAA